MHVSNVQMQLYFEKVVDTFILIYELQMKLINTQHYVRSRCKHRIIILHIQLFTKTCYYFF